MSGRCERAPRASVLCLVALCVLSGTAWAQATPKAVLDCAELVTQVARRAEAAMVTTPGVGEAFHETAVFYVLTDEMNAAARTLGEDASWSVERGQAPAFCRPFKGEGELEDCWVVGRPHYPGSAKAATVTEARRIKIGIPLVEEIPEDREGPLAFIVAHELAHVAMGHTIPDELIPEVPVLVPLLEGYSRENEYEADRMAMLASIAAGYSYDALLGFAEMCVGDPEHDAIGLETHPSWSERLAALDSPDQGHWQGSVVFEAGLMEVVAADFADAYESFIATAELLPRETAPLANAGAAALMAHYDTMGPAALNRLALEGGSLPAPPWAAGLRRDLRGAEEPGEPPWLALAQEAYEAALALGEGDLPEAELGLAICRLVEPDADPGQVNADLVALWRRVQADPDPYLQAQLASAGCVAARLSGLALDYWYQALDELALEAFGAPPDVAANLACVLVEKGTPEDKLEAQMTVEFQLVTLAEGSPMRATFARLWRENWPDEDMPEPMLSRWRRARGVTLTTGETEILVRVPLSLNRLRDALGEGVESPAAGHEALRAIEYPELGLKCIAGTTGVFMAILAKPTGHIALERRDIGVDDGITVALGATRAELEESLGPFAIPMAVGAEYFHYYPEPSIAVLYDGEDNDAKASQLMVIPY